MRPLEERFRTLAASNTIDGLQRKYGDGLISIEEEALLYKWELDKSKHERMIERVLKPCPFCGSDVRVDARPPMYQSDDFDTCNFDAYMIICTNEDGCGFERFFDMEDVTLIVEAWNERTQWQKTPE